MRAAAALGAVLAPRRTALPPGSSTGCSASRPRPARAAQCVDISADFRYATRRGLRGGLQARARRAARAARVHLRACRNTSRARRRRTWRTRAALRPRRCWRACRCWRSGSIDTDAVRHRRHRQHRVGPQAGRGHAPSAAARRPVRIQRAGAPARAGDRRLRARRHAASRRSSTSCRTPGRSRAASTSRCRRRCKAARRAPRRWRRSREFYARLPASCA